MKVTYLPEDGKNFIPYEITGKIVSFNDGDLMFDVSKRKGTMKWLLTSARTIRVVW